jgi:hypothetical protein
MSLQKCKILFICPDHFECCERDSTGLFGWNRNYFSSTQKSFQRPRGFVELKAQQRAFTSATAPPAAATAAPPA